MSETTGDKTVPLKAGFRYVHEPFAFSEGPVPRLGGQETVTLLTERLNHSSGGVFLLTGFRGAGKTSLAYEVLEKILSQPKDRTIYITLNVAHPRSTEKILFEIIRRLYETLEASGTLQKLSEETAQTLTLSYARTSRIIDETQSKAFEQTLGTSLSTLGLSDQLSFSRKAIRSLATTAKFLTYSEDDAEHDILRLAHLFRTSNTPRHSILANLLRQVLPSRYSRQLTPNRIIIVVDELDKLTASTAGLVALEHLLVRLKNLLTAKGIFFLLIGGSDLYERWLQDTRRGNSLYESVFAWHQWVPCCWEVASELLTAVAEDTTAYSLSDVQDFTDYLDFKARGIPRRLLIEFNSFVAWDRGRPIINIPRSAMAHISFFAALQNVVVRYNENTLISDPVLASPFDYDRKKLATYYIIDWVIRTGGRIFSASELFADEQPQEEIHPSLLLRIDEIDTFLTYLADESLLEEVTQRASDRTIIPNVPKQNARLFRLPSQLADQLRRTEGHGIGVAGQQPATMLLPALKGAVEPESRGQSKSGQMAPFVPSFGDAISEELLSRYEIVREIGRGAMASVYCAYDKALQRDVVIKIPQRQLRGDERVVERFRREARIGPLLNHPHVVRVFDVLTGEDPALVMEFLDGPTLYDLLQERKGLSYSDALGIAIDIAEGLEYIHSNGFYRIDLKPSNIILADRGAVIIDLGIAKEFYPDGRSRTITDTGSVVGTILYMSPEQLAGDKVDPRTDIFSFGAILYEMLSGRPAWDEPNAMAISYAIVNEDLDFKGLDLPEDVKSLLMKCTEKEPEVRLASSAELVAELNRMRGRP